MFMVLSSWQSNWHQNQFFRFQTIVFASLVTDGRTDGPMPIACLAWRVKSLVLLLTRDLSLTLGVSPSTIQCNSQSQYR